MPPLALHYTVISVLHLTRTVRFAINPPPAPAALDSPSPDDRNGYGGRPSMTGVGAHHEVRIRLTGVPGADTGYLMDIKKIDRAARSTLVPAITRAFHDPARPDPCDVLRPTLTPLAEALGSTLTSVRWFLSPYYSIEMSSSPASLPAAAILRQRFDFAAAHRLHVASLSNEENRALFGKCNNPRGHGHNYQFEPAVRLPLDAAARFTLQDLERISESTIIERFDHTHLNEDTTEFAADTGVNPSVENIARVFFGLLDAALRRAHPGVSLLHLTVWETDRTSATFPAGPYPD